MHLTPEQTCYLQLLISEVAVKNQFYRPGIPMEQDVCLRTIMSNQNAIMTMLLKQAGVDMERVTAKVGSIYYEQEHGEYVIN